MKAIEWMWTGVAAAIAAIPTAVSAQTGMVIEQAPLPPSRATGMPTIAPPADSEDVDLTGLSAIELAERRARHELNSAQADFARQQQERNIQSQRDFDAAVRAREATIRRQQAEHQAALRALEDQHAAAMERWRADVAACQAGDHSRCAPQ